MQQDHKHEWKFDFKDLKNCFINRKTKEVQCIIKVFMGQFLEWTISLFCKINKFYLDTG